MLYYQKFNYYIVSTTMVMNIKWYQVNTDSSLRKYNKLSLNYLNALCFNNNKSFKILTVKQVFFKNALVPARHP